MGKKDNTILSSSKLHVRIRLFFKAFNDFSALPRPRLWWPHAVSADAEPSPDENTAALPAVTPGDREPWPGQQEDWRAAPLPPARRQFLLFK